MRTNRPNPPDRNAEGVVISRISPEAELRRTVLACLLYERSFYESGSVIAARIAELVPLVPRDAVFDLAVEARERMKLRHVPLLLAVEMAKHASHKTRVTELLERVIQRPDELTEVLALYARGRTGRKRLGKLSRRVLEGVQAAFPKFDAFALARYDRAGAVKLRDALFLTHPKPRDAEQAETWKRLVAETLPTPDTWETAITAAGADPAKKKVEWTRLLVEGKLGALALLRNLRNLAAAGVERALVIDALARLDVSRVLPFRFVAAARHAPELEEELERAMYRATEGLPKLRGHTALVVDTSPSMWLARISARSEMTRFDAAAALAILAREVAETVRVYAFNQEGYVVPPRRGFALRDALLATKGDASCGGLGVELANRAGYDRIVVITDGQWHLMRDGAYGRQIYAMGEAREVAPKPLTERAYLVNVATDRNGVNFGEWTSLDGWSEAILDYVAASEGLGNEVAAAEEELP